MSLSQHIPVIVEDYYPRGREVSLSAIFREIIHSHYAEFQRRLELFGYSFAPVDTDVFYSNFGEHPPASFIVDSRGYPILRPGFGRVWLVFLHFVGGVSVLVARYVQFGNGHVYLFGDRESGLRVNLEEGRVSISAVALSAARVPDIIQDGVDVL